MGATGVQAVTGNRTGEPEVSIVMAVHNSAPTLAAAICSLLAQTFRNWELIVVDDASTDHFQAVMARFSDPRIRILSNPTRQGLAASLNRGVEGASAPSLARMDADDICYPARLERQLRLLQAQPSIDLLGTAIMMFRDDGTPLGIAPAPAGHEAICASGLAGSYNLYHPTWMGRTDWFRRHRYDPAFSKAQDFELLLRAAPTSRYANLPEALVGYRVDPVIRLRKRLQTRVHVLKAVARNAATARVRMALLRILGVTIGKAGLDVASSLGRGALGRRLLLRRPSASEADAWRDIWSSVQNAAARTRSQPARDQ
ncbi:MAG TPA: glycosyltransferase family A protein [Rhodocyclaceae bacterium]|nr:glycosyltransferase family A protein [Rhodocyclaceae bacterium]